MMLPSLLVYGVGIMLAVMWRRRAPRAALMAGAGLALMLLTGIGITIAHAYLATRLAPSQLG